MQEQMIAALCGQSQGLAQHCAMVKKVTPRFKKGPPKHFVKAWRKYRGFTQEQLAEIVGVSHGAIGQLERGQMSYTQPMLEALADALHCEPADLIMRDPESPIWSVYENLKKASPEQQKQIADIVEIFRKAG